MVKRILYLLIFTIPVLASGQNFKQSDSGGLGHGEVFSPFKNNPKDSTKKEIAL